jgi:UDP-glucose 4-epimerase
MFRVLVTGGAGFIGSSLVSALMQLKKCHVIVLDNLSRGNQKNISKWLESSNFEFVQADLVDNPGPLNGNEPSPIQKAVECSDTIFHLAANPDVAIGAENTRIDFQQNILATYNLLETIRKSGTRVDQDNSPKNQNKQERKRLIFTSSSTIYGEAAKRPTPEIYSPLYPVSLYGATKLACEAMISGYCHMFDIQCAIARLANIVGPTNNHGVVYDFITKLSSHPQYLDILGNGQQNKSYLHIDDCVSALLLISEKMQAGYDITSDNHGRNNNIIPYENLNTENTMSQKDKETLQKRIKLKVVNVGSDDTITVMEIAKIVINELALKDEEVRKKFNEDNFEGGRGWKGDVPNFWLDCSNLKSSGWRPKHGKSSDAVIQTCREYLKSRGMKKNH